MEPVDLARSARCDGGTLAFSFFGDHAGRAGGILIGHCLDMEAPEPVVALREGLGVGVGFLDLADVRLEREERVVDREGHLAHDRIVVPQEGIKVFVDGSGVGVFDGEDGDVVGVDGLPHLREGRKAMDGVVGDIESVGDRLGDDGSVGAGDALVGDVHRKINKLFYFGEFYWPNRYNPLHKTFKKGYCKTCIPMSWRVNHTFGYKIASNRCHTLYFCTVFSSYIT